MSLLVKKAVKRVLKSKYPALLLIMNVILRFTRSSI